MILPQDIGWLSRSHASRNSLLLMLTEVQAFSSRANPLRFIHPLSTPFSPTGFQSVASENRQTPAASEVISSESGGVILGTFGYTEY